MSTNFINKLEEFLGESDKTINIAAKHKCLNDATILANDNIPFMIQLATKLDLIRKQIDNAISN